MELSDVIGLLGRKLHKDISGFGEVKFYDNAPEKEFGFLSSTDGDVFIHGSRGYEFSESDGDFPVLVIPDRNPNKSLSNPPRRGDTILFIAEQGPRGFRSTKWVKWVESEFLATIEKMDARPIIRLMERRGHKCQSPLMRGGNDGYFEKWKGSVLDQLREKFPKNRFRIEESSDYAMYFEILNTITNEWEPHHDPR